MLSVLTPAEQAILVALVEKLGQRPSARPAGEAAHEALHLFPLFCRVHRIADNLKQVPYDPVAVNLLKGEHATESYASVNPQRRVPGGHQRDGAPAIARHPRVSRRDLSRAAPASGRRRREGARRAVCALIAATSIRSTMPARWPISSSASVRTGPGGCAHWVRQGFDAIERMLEPGPFAFGSRPTLADVYLVPQVFNARRFNVPPIRIPGLLPSVGPAGPWALKAAAPDRQPDAA